ncbi:hypothetical protein A9R05_44310 (plasmid) [Burkholderia sp. KK1]|nr:hypothetical protein A9R05_44310 [Burkholderia sp. KK1]
MVRLAGKAMSQHGKSPVNQWLNGALDGLRNGLDEPSSLQLCLRQRGIVFTACGAFLFQHTMDLVVRAVAKILDEFLTVF